MRIFGLERIVPPLVIAFADRLTVLQLFCYCHFATMQTSSVAGLTLNLVAFTRATLVLLCFGENRCSRVV